MQRPPNWIWLTMKQPPAGWEPFQKPPQTESKQPRADSSQTTKLAHVANSLFCACTATHTIGESHFYHLYCFQRRQKKKITRQRRGRCYLNVCSVEIHIKLQEKACTYRQNGQPKWSSRRHLTRSPAVWCSKHRDVDRLQPADLCPEPRTAQRNI